MTDLILIRVFFILLVACAAYFLQPLQIDRPVAAAAGALIGITIVLFEIRLKQVSLKRLIGAATGSVMGIFGASTETEKRP